MRSWLRTSGPGSVTGSGSRSAHSLLVSLLVSTWVEGSGATSTVRGGCPAPWLPLTPIRLALALSQQQQHDACMPKSITIRDIPDETSAELAARAAVTGRSLQEYLRARLVELADAPEPEVWLARVRQRKRATGGSISVQRILAHRDADRP